MKHVRIPAVFAVLAASAAVAWGATNFVQKADGSMCFRSTTGLAETDNWCWSNIGALTIGSTAVNTAPLTAQARTVLRVCGDATTVNANTIYYGPSQVLVTSATVGQMTCNTTAAGNATESTADAPAMEARAFYPLGMNCWVVDTDVASVSFTLRSAEAAITPAISLSIADNVLNGSATATATTAVASAATLAVAVASASDVTKANVPFICEISVAY